MTRRNRTRRGSVYVAVLGAAMVVSMTALCAIHVQQIEVRRAASERSLNEARLLAQSAIEFALGRIDLDPDWRSNYQSGDLNPDASESPTSIGNGGLRFKLVDADGDLADDVNDPVTIYGYGLIGRATFVYQATYAPDGGGHMALVPGSWKRAAAD
jgi:hypothetical protein